MDLASVIQRLQLFNEMATKLERKGFVEKMLESGVQFTFEFSPNRWGIKGKIERYGPNEDEIDAFLLTLRFFVQDKDGISIRKIAEYYNRHLPIQSFLVQKINDLRAYWHEYMSEKSSVTMDGEDITRSKLFDVFLWGGFAHPNPAKKAIYDEWSKRISFPLFSK